MGNTASVEERVAQVSEGRTDLHNLFKVFASLMPKGSAEAKHERSEAWKEVDPNGNGYVSLAEFDGWIQKRTISTFRSLGIEDSEYYLLCWKRFRSSYIRAFNDAKDIASAKGIRGVGWA